MLCSEACTSLRNNRCYWPCSTYVMHHKYYVYPLSISSDAAAIAVPTGYRALGARRRIREILSSTKSDVHSDAAAGIKFHDIYKQYPIYARIRKHTSSRRPCTCHTTLLYTKHCRQIYFSQQSLHNIVI